MESTASDAAQLYFKGPCRPQNWSIPDSVIYYMAKNPSSSKLYQKLIRSCKYFFYKNRINVCCMLTYFPRQSNSKKIDIWKISDKAVKKIIYFKNVSTKLWITDNVDTGFGNIKPNIMSSVIPNIYQCDAKFLKLYYQNISFNEYILLASEAEQIYLNRTTVNNNDGFIVPLEKLVEATAKVKTIVLYSNDIDKSITSETVKNLLKIPHFVNFSAFDINNVSEDFDIENFYNYVKTNTNTIFPLCFSSSISDAYKNRLDHIVDEIVDNDYLAYKPPFIVFNGMNQEKIDKLYALVSSSI